MVASTKSKSSTTRKTVSKLDQAAPAAAKALKAANKKTLVTSTETSRKDSNAKDKLLIPAQEAGENILFASIPAGFREKYVPYPTNPDHTCGRLMIPFYPMGEGRQNGIGLPMVHCLAQQGLKDPHGVAFDEEVASRKQFVSLSLTWPGYYPMLNWLVKIPVFKVDGLALTRTELARIIADQYRSFYDLCCTDAYQNTSDPDWRLGPGGFAFEDIRLTGLWTSGQDVWHASVMVLTPVDYDAWAKAGLAFAVPEGTNASNTASNTLPYTVNDISTVEPDAGEDKLDEFQLSDEEWEKLLHGNWDDTFK